MVGDSVKVFRVGSNPTTATCVILPGDTFARMCHVNLGEITGALRVDGQTFPITRIEITPTGIKFTSSVVHTLRALSGPVEVLTADGEVAVVGTEIIEFAEHSDCTFWYQINIDILFVSDGEVDARR